MLTKPQNIVPIAVVFELMLGLIGAGLAKWTGVNLQAMLQPTADSGWRGLLATLPMLILLVFLTRSLWPPLLELRRQVESLVRQLFGSAAVWELALVAAAAGIGEEILFRGALQPLIASWSTDLAGLIAVSLLFGVLHAASPAYFVLATLFGFYLGWLAQAYNDLVAPMITHAAYDFAALWWVQRRVRSD